MGNWIKDNKLITNEELNKIKNDFTVKNRLKSAFITPTKAYIRYKPLNNLKIYNINESIFDDFSNFFISSKLNKTFSADDISLFISYQNGNNILILRSEKEKKIFLNCDKDLSQIALDD